MEPLILDKFGPVLGLKNPRCRFRSAVNNGVRSNAVAARSWPWLLSALLALPLHAAPSAQEYFQKGSQALAQRQTPQAVQYFKQALAINPDLALAWRGLGVALGQQGLWSESVQAHRRATRLLPQQAQGWLNLGWAEHRNGKDKVAVKVLNHALTLDPQNPQVLNALGIVYLFLNQPAQAVQATRQVIQIDPKNGTAYYNLGLALHRLGEFTPSRQALEQAQRYEPRNPHPQVALAMVWDSAGDAEKAVAIYKKTVQMDPRYRNSAYLDQLIEADFSKEQVAQLKKIYKRWQAGSI